MRDLAEVAFESQFATAIRDYFQENRPEVIIETGLYYGRGSTKIICNLIKHLKMNESEFYSIECNPKNIEIAKIYLKEDNLIDYVEICEGLSFPEGLLPSKDTIGEDIKEAKRNRMFVDHETENLHWYEKETQQYVMDDVLGHLLSNVIKKADFLLLDSGGHIGNIEFNYALSLLRNPCAIALDDVHHLKHYKSLEKIKSDPRFRLIHESSEKFGSALAVFTP